MGGGPRTGRNLAMQYETCRHVKEDGTLCGCPALKHRQYCYSHLTHRGRRLRLALALSRNEPYQLLIPPLENLGSMRVALSEVVQALATGQLNHRAAGLMLYAIQQASTMTLRMAQIEASLQATQEKAPAADVPRLQEYPDFERHFDIPPDIDLDAEADRVTRRAEEQAAALSIAPNPLPGTDCPVPPKNHYTREEAFQILQWEVHSLRKQIRQAQELTQPDEKRQEDKKKRSASAYAPLPEPLSSRA